MKLLSLILTYVMGKFSSPPSSLMMAEQLLDKSRQLLMMATIAVAGAALFCAGFIIALINATSQYDAAGSIYMSSTFITGLVLAAVSLAVLLVTFSKKTWEGRQAANLQLSKKKETEHRSPIERALTLLVTDFVDERRSRRENTRTNYETNPQYPRSSPQRGSVSDQQSVIH